MFLSVLFALSLVLSSGGAVSCEEAENQAKPVGIAEFRAMARNLWMGLAEYSYKNGLYKFARTDYAKAAKYGAKLPEDIEFPDKPLPDEAHKLLGEWGCRRKEMIHKLDMAAKELLGSCKAEDKERAVAAILAELPNHREARRKQGEVYTDELGWVGGLKMICYKSGKLPFKGKWLAREKVCRYRNVWRNAWELHSEHFTVRTNCAPKTGRQMLKFLEAHRLAFIREYGELELCEPHSRMRVNLFSSRQSFRMQCEKVVSGSGGVGGFYFEGTGELYICNRKGSQGWLTDPVIASHEATHLLLFHLQRHRFKSFYGKPGAWVNEGLAVFNESFYYYADRVAFVNFERFFPIQFVRKYEDRYPLESLGAFEKRRGDSFADVPNKMRNYVQASLMTGFFLTATEGRYREGYFKYVRNVFAGKGSTTLFEECFGCRADGFQDEFERVVEGIGEEEAVSNTGAIMRRILIISLTIALLLAGNACAEDGEFVKFYLSLSSDPSPEEVERLYVLLDGDSSPKWDEGNALFITGVSDFLNVRGIDREFKRNNLHITFIDNADGKKGFVRGINKRSLHYYRIISRLLLERATSDAPT